MSGTAPSEAPEQDRDGGQPADGATPEQPGFGSRGKARRRARFLRRARELAYRDLGGLVYNLHRFGQRNDALVLGKLGTLAHIDNELRSLETALRERRPVTVLREAGITACPRCAAIHSSEDRFCPNCGLPMARNVDLPIGAGSEAHAPPPAPAVQAPPPAPYAQAPYAQTPYAATPAQAPATPAQAPATAVYPATAPGPPAPAAAPSAPGASPPGENGAPAGPSPSQSSEESTEILHPRTPGT